MVEAPSLSLTFLGSLDCCDLHVCISCWTWNTTYINLHRGGLEGRVCAVAGCNSEFYVKTHGPCSHCRGTQSAVRAEHDMQPKLLNEITVSLFPPKTKQFTVTGTTCTSLHKQVSYWNTVMSSPHRADWIPVRASLRNTFVTWLACRASACDWEENDDFIG